MRRLLVIAAALGLMWALQTVHSSAQGTAGMALAAIGFVVLASFTIGDLLSGLGLPRITGYIVSGVVLGPQIIGVLSAPVVAKMGVFNTLALGLIALSAGLEIEVGAMRRVMRTMIAMTAVKVVLLLVVVGGGLYLMHLYVLPLPVSDEGGAIFLVTLIAVLGIGTSPSISLAIVKETKARGRLTDITLGLAVLKDVVVVVALAVTIAVGNDALSPENSAGVAPVVLEMAQHLGLSIAFGAGVGVLLILFVKYVHRELLLGAVVAVLLTAEASAYFNFELLLVLIAAGFVVRNFSEQEHSLMPALLRISLPVFVVFFTTAGAKVDLAATKSVLPFAGVAVVGRALVYYVAARFGVWVGREGSAVRKNAWFGLLPQAGVTLGLVLLTSHQVPALREEILRIGLAIVSINLLVGPVLLGIALGRAGEIPGRARLATAPMMPVSTDAIADLESTLRPRQSKPPVLSDARLARAREQLTEGLEAWVTRLTEQVIVPLADRGRVAIVRLVSEHKQHENTAAAVRTMLETASADPSEGLEKQLRTAHLDARALVEALPERFEVVTERRLLRLAARDGVLIWVSKLLKRVALVLRFKPKRRVPVRLAARATSEERLAEVLGNVVPAWFDARSDTMDELAKLVSSANDVETVRQAVARRVAQFVEDATNDLRAGVAAVLDEFHEHLATLGGPSSPPSALRLFEIEQRAQRRLSSLDEAAKRGREVMRARMTTLHADALYAHVTASLDEEIQGMVSRPLAIVAQEVTPIVHQALEHLPATDDWSQLTSGDDPLALLAEVLDRALDEHAVAHLRGLQMKYYHATQQAKLLARLAGKLEGVPAKLVVVDRHAGSAATLLSLEPARRLEEALIEDFAPDLVAAIRPLGDLVSSIDARVNKALSVASRGVAAARATEERTGARIAAAREPVARARKELEALVEELTTVGNSTSEAALQVMNDTRERVAVALGRKSPGAANAHPGRRHQVRWSPIVDRMSRRLVRLRQRGEVLVRGLLGRQDVREWIIRTGAARLDAVAMREFVTRHHAPAEELNLPKVYAELVSPAPIDDIRLATARRADLDTLVEVLQPGNKEDFTSVLIFGERGSGRTSMINLLGHRLARRRVIRIDARYHARVGGPLGAMAAELNVSSDPAELASALQKSPSIVLLDDIERFLRASVAGVDDLDRFLRLVRTTASHTHWVVTAQTATIDLVDPLVHLSETFGRRIHLEPVDVEELDRVIERRIQLSGLDIRCIDGSRRTRLRPREAQRRYLRTLHAIARGNLRRAVLLHARSITKDGEGGLVARDPRAPGLPFLRHLGSGPVAALSLVTRYVELTVEELAEGLAVPAADVDQYLLPLRSAGLVESSSGRSTLGIPPHLVDAVCTSLADLGLRPGGEV